MRDVYDGTMWRQLCAEYLCRREKVISLVLLGSADWFAPFQKHYSVGIVQLLLLNLPVQERIKTENALFSVAMHGPKEVSYTLDYQLQFLVAELEALSNGVQVKVGGETYTLYARLFGCVADLPAMAKLFGISGHSAAHFCPFCQLNASTGATHIRYSGDPSSARGARAVAASRSSSGLPDVAIPEAVLVEWVQELGRSPLASAAASTRRPSPLASSASARQAAAPVSARRQQPVRQAALRIRGCRYDDDDDYASDDASSECDDDGEEEQEASDDGDDDEEEEDGDDDDDDEDEYGGGRRGNRAAASSSRDAGAPPAAAPSARKRGRPKGPGNGKKAKRAPDARSAALILATVGTARDLGHERARALAHLTFRRNRSVSGLGPWHPENRIDGSTRYSILWTVPDFNPLEGRGLDIMHALLLGVVKSVVEALAFEGPELQQIQELIKKTVVVSRAKIHGKVANKFERVSAHEWRLIAQLYLGAIIRRIGRVSDHGALCRMLSAIVLVACQREILPSDVNALEQLIKAFVSRLANELPAAVKTNAHLLLHLADRIRLWGVPSSYWLFPMERVNKVVKNIPNSGRGGEVEQLCLRRLLQRSALVNAVPGLSLAAAPANRPGDLLYGERQPEEAWHAAFPHRRNRRIAAVANFVTLLDGTQISVPSKNLPWRILARHDGQLRPAFAQAFYRTEAGEAYAVVHLLQRHPREGSSDVVTDFSPGVQERIDLLDAEWTAASVNIADVRVRDIEGLCAFVPTMNTNVILAPPLLTL